MQATVTFSMNYDNDLTSSNSLAHYISPGHQTFSPLAWLASVHSVGQLTM